MPKTVSLTVEIPDSVSENEARLSLALKLFELSRVSLGQAAEVAGFSKHAFIEVLSQYHIPVVNYPAEDLREEMNA